VPIQEEGTCQRAQTGSGYAAGEGTTKGSISVDADRDISQQEASRKAPLAIVLLIFGIVLGGGAAVWLLVAVFGFDNTPAVLAGPLVAGGAIAGGLLTVLVAAFFGRLSRWIASRGRGKVKP
jgi:hypothetical protein